MRWAGWQVLTAGGLAALASLADEPRGLAERVVADMERLPEMRSGGTHGTPVLALSEVFAAEGRRSLRIEYESREDDSCWVHFPVDGAEGFDALAFDLYIERDNGARLVVDMQQDAGPGEPSSRFRAVLSPGPFIDGWAPVRLSLNSGFKFGGDAAPDWSKIRRIGFWWTGPMSGKGIAYLDRLRFESLGEGARNLLYNSSFEIATLPDVPDGWTRDLNRPPFGADVWSLDSTTAFHGRQSLRIGRAGKYARSWDRRTFVEPGKPYTFSVHLRAEAEGTRAELQLRGVGSATVEVGPEWRRFSVTGTAQRPDTVAFVHLRSEGTLWLDAAQLEAGETAGDYHPSAADLQPDEARVPRRRTLAPGQRAALALPTLRLVRAATPPVLDGRLDDACWQAAEEAAPFVELEQNRPAAPQSSAWMSFDDRALYVALRAEDPDPEAVRRQIESLRHPPWGGDLAELFIAPGRDRESYYHFALNAAGARYAGRYARRELFAGDPSSWRCDWQAAGSFDDAGWTVEAAIPYSCFDLRPDFELSDTLGVNFCRGNPRTGQNSSWAFAFGGFHTPEAFGRAEGFDADLARHRLTVSPPEWHRGVASAAVAHAGPEARRLQAVFFTETQQVVHASASVAVEIPPGQTVRIECPLALGDARTGQELSLRLEDANGPVFVSQPRFLGAVDAAPLELPGTQYDFYTTGDAAARARCLVEPPQDAAGPLRLQWRLEAGGATLRTFEDAAPRPGVNEWTFELAGLAEGTYRLRAQLLDGERTVAEETRDFRILPPARHQVRIDRWGRFLVCDGQPLLVYGFYNNLQKGAEEDWVGALDLVKEAGCTAQLNYYYSDVGWMLDRAAERDIKLWVHLSWMLSYWIPKYEAWDGKYASREEAMAHLREVVSTYRDHPSLLGWCTLDEPGNRPELFTSDYVLEAYRTIKALDPHHPCAFSHLTRLGEVDTYGAATDVAIIPYGVRGAQHDRLFQEFWTAGFPVFVNRPCFGALAGVAHEPTPAEVRLALYKAFILGARGALSYTFRCTSESTWREFGAIAGEFRQLAPALLGEAPAVPVEVQPAGEDLRAVALPQDGHWWLLAVNTATEARAATFGLGRLPELRAALPHFGAPEATLHREARALAVLLPPSSTAVYQLTPDLP